MQCTRCGSDFVLSNQLDPDAILAKLHTRGMPTWFSYGCWAAAHVVNHNHPRHECGACGHKF